MEKFCYLALNTGYEEVWWPQQDETEMSLAAMPVEVKGKEYNDSLYCVQYVGFIAVRPILIATIIFQVLLRGGTVYRDMLKGEEARREDMDVDIESVTPRKQRKAVKMKHAKSSESRKVLANETKFLDPPKVPLG
ncbi:hypothetical protein OS493_029364 [Desmophyllum pertusum]|uniref:Uncharacterized protein n=1 Tax=Desmophyllum pertusum TaxID=174260 RepID=A0A9W9YWT1_9CNID|nr:hypothetical protein OS493_029364 [Desmophyllum pertusum]